MKRLGYLLPLLVLIGALIALFTFVIRATTETRERIGQVERHLDHSHRLSETLHEIALGMSLAEADARAYSLSRDPNAPARFEQHCRQVESAIAATRALTPGDPVQSRRVAAVSSIVEMQLARMTSAMASANPGLAAIRDDSPDQRLDAVFSAIKFEEFRRLQANTQAVGKAIRITESRVAASLWAFVGVLGLLTTINILHLNHRARTQQALREANDALRRERHSLQAVTLFLSEVVKAKFDVLDIMKLVTDRTLELTGATGVVIELLEGNELVYRTSTGELAGTVGTRLKVDGSFSGLCIKTNRILICTDTETDDRVDRELTDRLGIRSMVAVPLMLDGSNAGVLKVTSSRPGAFDERSVEVLELMGGVIATAMSRATQFQANEALLTEKTEALTSLQEAQGELKQQLERVEDLNIVLRFQSDELIKANAALEALATTDGLTGLKNHRAFQERLREECHRAARYRTPLSVVLLDVDRFKQYNDTFGHPAGDAVLNRVARILEGVIRECDLVARYGGEEFVYILPQTDLDSAYTVAERCRARIEAAAWDLRPITASLGVAALDLDHADAADLVARADAALYAAKTRGRNRVALDGVETRVNGALAA